MWASALTGSGFESQPPSLYNHVALAHFLKFCAQLPSVERDNKRTVFVMLVYNLNKTVYQKQKELQFRLLQLLTLVNLQPATRKQIQKVQGLSARMNFRPLSKVPALRITAPMTDASSLGFCN